MEYWIIKRPEGGYSFPFSTHNEEWCWKTFVESWSDRKWANKEHHEHLEKLGSELREMGYLPVKVNIHEVPR